MTNEDVTWADKRDILSFEISRFKARAEWLFPLTTHRYKRFFFESSVERKLDLASKQFEGSINPRRIVKILHVNLQKSCPIRRERVMSHGGVGLNEFEIEIRGFYIVEKSVKYVLYMPSGETRLWTRG